MLDLKTSKKFKTTNQHKNLLKVEAHFLFDKKTYQTKWDSHLCFLMKQFSKCFKDLPTSNHQKVCFMIQMLRMTTFASKTLCHALNLSKIEAPLARVRRVRPSPSIIKFVDKSKSKTSLICGLDELKEKWPKDLK